MLKTLPKSLSKKPFTYQEACKCGLTQYAIRKFLEDGVIERLERGLYRSVGEDLSEEELYRRAVKRAGKPSAVCLLSALSYYELTDTIPKKVWLMVPAGKRIKSPNIKLYRARDPRWKVGVVTQDGYSITSLERTIVDSLTLKTLVAPRLGIDALKRAIFGKQTTAAKILKISDMLGVKHRVLPTIEALS